MLSNWIHDFVVALFNEIHIIEMSCHYILLIHDFMNHSKKFGIVIYNHFCSANINGVFVDINECTAGTDNCPNYHYCHNEIGSFNCSCRPGYELLLDGITCRGLQYLSIILP